jgi:hypothetical protein
LTLVVDDINLQRLASILPERLALNAVLCGAAERALLRAFERCGMRQLPDSETLAIGLSAFMQKGVG